MRPEETPFKTCWYGSNLEGYRPCDYTYESYVYQTLPTLPKGIFEGTLAWLIEPTKNNNVLPEKIAQLRKAQRDGFVTKVATCLPKLVTDAETKGFVLPKAFLAFYSQPKYFALITSCTGCFFDIPETLVPSQQLGQGYFLPFYHDSQGCLHWYLHLLKSGGHCVVVTGVPIGEEPDAFDLPEATEIQFCAESFEEFIYRVWIENRIWYQLNNSKAPLTDELLVYAEASRNTIVLKNIVSQSRSDFSAEGRGS
jgi:hypothetical protein